MRVVIGEDDGLLRDGLAAMLHQRGIDVVAAAADADQLLVEGRRHRPDLVLTDIRMPPNGADDGLQSALRLRRERPATRLFVLSQHLQRRYAAELLASGPGGVGYLLKQRVTDSAAFCAALRDVAAGGTVIDPRVVAVMLARASGSSDIVHRLTDRQREVLALLAEGRSNAAIARQLDIGEKTVVQHVSLIYDQLGLPPNDDDHRRVLAVLRYLESVASR